MVATFSPHRDTGGTLHLPSPTGIHHVDAGSAIRQLRRSLSRSPSKSSDFRLLPSRNQSPSSKNAPFISSPLSPSSRRTSGNLFLVPTQSNPSPLAIPFPPSAKINRPNLRRTGNLQAARPKPNPTSPAKRVLSDSRDHGNSTPTQADSPSREGPPLKKDTNSQTHISAIGSTTPPSPVADPMESLLAPNPAHSRIEKRRSGTFGPFPSTASPLKRSDGIMNLDQASQGSPSAKRRSLHGASVGSDFNIFDHEGGTTSPTEPSEIGMGEAGQQPQKSQPSDPTPGPTPNYFSTIPKRSSSLRKSTLQQRQSGSFFARTRGHGDHFNDSSPMAPKARQRMSLDGHLFSPNNRDTTPPLHGLFSNIPTSVPTPAPTAPQNPTTQFHHPAHPLSRTITQSSSGSSIADDSPTHEPLRRSERPKPILNFSKSLPAGSARPVGFGPPAQEDSNESTDGSFATPNNYKLVKPLPAAFMSTGLISKKNRNVDDPMNNLGSSKNMPDTPCKRQTNIIPGIQRPFVEKSVAKPQPRHPFAPPSTPAPGNSTSGPAQRGTGIFGRNFSRPSISRRGSFVSVDGDDRSQSQSPAQQSSQSTIDSDLPPTPTKQSSVSHSGNLFSRSRMAPVDRTQSLSGQKGSSCKFSSIESSPSDMDEDSDSVMEDSPSAYLSRKSSDTTLPFPSSIPRSRLMRNFNSPTPNSKQLFFLPSSSPSDTHSKFGNTKCNEPHAATPFYNKFDRASPHTPQEHILPPDPSGLSISVHSDHGFSQQDQNSSTLPATPTAPREYFVPVGKQSTLSLSTYNVANVDTSLTSRFEKVELVGTGEFSQVYRVTQTQQSSPFQSIFSLPSKGSNPSTKSLERVCAVKKSKHPYTGVKDRQRRIHEVDVLKALKDSDHIISFMDSWEDKNHLYIQTEFCEEGSLDMFLAQVGLKARLDDFRIWKILLELSLGLKHIHDSGFIHLDLKPANILVTFEGVLKIADFGMATRWPAAAGIEGEGDREYIGPEILMGRYDKPADIFALGLIMFETAGNVELPDNGLSWQKLRNGDMSDVPSLTWTSGMSNILRDATGNPLPEDSSFEEFCQSDLGDDSFGQPEFFGSQKKQQAKPVKTARSGELTEPPTFMVDATNDQALDKIVRWMISPDPADRPVADQILQTYGVQWAESRRRAGATVYEGNWGPADEVLAEDAEMIDV